jgi:hypothetical protein
LPKIILPNFRADYSEQVRDWLGISDATASSTDTTARFLWHAEDGDVLVIPDTVDPDFPGYVADTLGIDGTSVHVERTQTPLSEAVLQDPEFIDRLAAHTGTGAGWSLFPCVSTRAAAQLTRKLNVAALDGYEFAMQNGIDLLNMKSTFRRLAAGLGTPLTDGVVARGPAEVRSAIQELIAETGMVIAKQDRSGGGHGNIGISTSPESSFPGTREVLAYANDQLDTLADTLWSQLTDTQNQFITLETYHRADQRFFFEYHLDGDRARFLHSSILKYEQLPEGSGGSAKWIGLDSPSRSEFEATLKPAEEFIELVRTIGYRGYVNIDGIVLDDGRVFFHEINARWSGGLIYHTVAERLLGHDYARNNFFSSILNVVPAGLADLLRSIERAGARYDKDSGEGAVVLGCNSDLGPGAELLVFSKDWDRLTAMKDEIATTAGTLS